MLQLKGLKQTTPNELLRHQHVSPLLLELQLMYVRKARALLKSNDVPYTHLTAPFSWHFTQPLPISDRFFVHDVKKKTEMTFLGYCI